LPSKFVKTKRKKFADFCRLFRRLAYPDTMQAIVGLLRFHLPCAPQAMGP